MEKHGPNFSSQPDMKDLPLASLWKLVLIDSLKDHSERIKDICDILLRRLFQTNSIGSRSGEYFGRKTRVIPMLSANFRVSAALC